MFANGNTNQSGLGYGKRAWGISESIFGSTSLTGADGDPVDKWVKARAKLLPNGSGIVGLRRAEMVITPQGVKSKGLAISYARYNNGDPTANSDYPTLAVFAKAQASTGNVLKLTLRALPDDWVKEGEWAVGSTLDNRFAEYTRTLSGFLQPVVDLTANAADVVNIDENGTVHLANDLVAPQGTKLTLLRTKTVIKGNYNGDYHTLTQTNNRTIQLSGWDGGTAYGGQLRLWVMTTAAYPADIVGQRITSKKVGKPNFSFAGRR